MQSAYDSSRTGRSSLTIEIRGLLDGCWALSLAANDKLGIPVDVAHGFASSVWNTNAKRLMRTRGQSEAAMMVVRG